MSNVDYTFGGKYSGSGSRGDSNSYTNSPLSGSISTEPRRVNAKMYQHVSSRSCTSVPPPTGPTQNPTPAPSPEPSPRPPCTGALVEVDVLTDGYPSETDWTIVDTCTGATVQANPTYSATNQQHSDSYCLPDSQYQVSAMPPFRFAGSAVRRCG